MEREVPQRIRFVYVPRDGVEPLEGVEVKERVNRFDEALGESGSALGDSRVIAAHVDVVANNPEMALGKGSSSQVEL
jgi:hypothetical protein